MQGMIFVTKNDGTVTRFTQRFPSGQYVMNNCIYEITYKKIIWRHYHVERQLWKFCKLAAEFSLLKKCRWAEMNCG